MPIAISRVDDRLVHGQVATSWIKSNNIQVVVVVDDDIPNDPVQTQVLQVSAPPGVKIYAMSPEKFMGKYQQGILDNYNLMLIFANVYAPQRLLQLGLELKTLNIGGLRFKPNRVQITKALSLSPEERQVIRELLNAGVEVEHRQLYSDNRVSLASII